MRFQNLSQEEMGTMNVLLFKPGEGSFFYKKIEVLNIDGSVLTFNRTKPNGARVKVITSLPFKLQEDEE